MKGIENGHNMEEDANDRMYMAYKDERARFGFDVTSLGELILLDGRIISHQGLLHYYRQWVGPNHNQDCATVVAARCTASECIYNGHVYNTRLQYEGTQHRDDGSQTSVLALA